MHFPVIFSAATTCSFVTRLLPPRGPHPARCRSMLQHCPLPIAHCPLPKYLLGWGFRGYNTCIFRGPAAIQWDISRPVWSLMHIEGAKTGAQPCSQRPNHAHRDPSSDAQRLPACAPKRFPHTWKLSPVYTAASRASMKTWQPSGGRARIHCIWQSLSSLAGPGPGTFC